MAPANPPQGLPAGSAPHSIRRRLNRPAVVAFAQNILLAAVSLVLTLAALELALRVYHGKLTTLSSQLRPPPNRAGNPIASYDATLGWIPRAGFFERAGDESWTVSDDGLRSNGLPFSSTERPIIVVGDSFTFGDEVRDHETWPAQLEQLLQIPVLNGGVFGYGVDQAFLRATHLLDAYRPQLVILAFISDDINRAEFSFYSGWKPYFEYVGGELALRNVPVPTGPAPARRYAALRTILGYSFLFDAILDRVAPEWWSPVTIQQAHHDGEQIAADLFVRLQTLVEANDARLLVMALGTNGRIGGNSRTGRLVEHAHRQGIDVVNLLPELENLSPDARDALFRPRGHYTASMNARVAARIAAHLADRD